VRARVSIRVCALRPCGGGVSPVRACVREYGGQPAAWACGGGGHGRERVRGAALLHRNRNFNKKSAEYHDEASERHPTASLRALYTSLPLRHLDLAEFISVLPFSPVESYKSISHNWHGLGMTVGLPRVAASPLQQPGVARPKRSRGRTTACRREPMR
jgi:hypothetical protein